MNVIMVKLKENVKLYQGFQVDNAMTPKGKDNMPADVYAAPHTPDGGALDESTLGGGAFDYSDVKTEGVKQRGAGCATKGFTSRGPLA